MVSVKGSKITLNGQSVTVVNQHKIKGVYRKELSSNGCGACCAAMALTLMGKKVKPADILGRAVALWGKWSKYPLISAHGLGVIIGGYGYIGKLAILSTSNTKTIKKLIDSALRSGKPVICWTKKGFSSGDHYVLAVGYNKLGRVVVANSGNRGPVNIVTLNALCESLKEGNGADKDWYRSASDSAGIVIVSRKPTVKKVDMGVTGTNMATLKRGAKGQQVKVLQKLLGDLPVGGAFGAKTEAVVKAYQKKHGLKSDGIVGPKTWEVILK